jgi:AcrR family transcriptional regulator
MPGKKDSERARREQILDSALQIAAERGLDGLTIRLVASNAHLSSGLVLFHYKARQQLLLALLDWLLARTLAPPVCATDRKNSGRALDQLVDLLRQEMVRLSREPARIRLIFEFWVKGVRDPEIGQRMRRQLVHYRNAFGGIGEAVLASDPARFGDVTVDGLATVAVSFIKGCAVQSMIDPDGFDIAQYLLAAERLVVRPGITARTSRSRRISPTGTNQG